MMLNQQLLQLQQQQQQQLFQLQQQATLTQTSQTQPQIFSIGDQQQPTILSHFSPASSPQQPREMIPQGYPVHLFPSGNVPLQRVPVTMPMPIPVSLAQRVPPPNQPNYEQLASLFRGLSPNRIQLQPPSDIIAEDMSKKPQQASSTPPAVVPQAVFFNTSNIPANPQVMPPTTPPLQRTISPGCITSPVGDVTSNIESNQKPATERPIGPATPETSDFVVCSPQTKQKLQVYSITVL